MKLKKIKLILCNWLEVLPESFLSSKHRRKQLCRHSLATTLPQLISKGNRTGSVQVFSKYQIKSYLLGCMMKVFS